MAIKVTCTDTPTLIERLSLARLLMSFVVFVNVLDVYVAEDEEVLDGFRARPSINIATRI